ncbi:MAG: FMN-binding protein [Erysipelotrichaceae bacterium]|nr:FMN-binding protein [Erysipelotrichaceae bacterium]
MKKRNKALIIILSIIVIGFVTGKIILNKIEKNLKQLSMITISDIDLSEISNGNYSGSYSTFPVAVEVDVMIEDHQIKEVMIIKHDNGQGKQAEDIIADVIEQQSLDVDMISGATYSSKVILLAIEDALLSIE